MSDFKPVEILLFEFLKASCEASEPGSALYDLEQHDTIYQSITKEHGFRISDCVSDPAPEPGGGLKEFDAEVQIVCFAKVQGRDKAHRQAATQKAFDIQMAITGLIYADQYLGERVCDTVIKRSPRSYDNFDGNPYAIALIPLVINPSGSQ